MFKATTMFSAAALLATQTSAVKLESLDRHDNISDEDMFEAMFELGGMLGYTLEDLAVEYDTLFVGDPVDYDAIRATSLADSSNFMIVMELAYRLGYHPEEIADAYDRMVSHV